MMPKMETVKLATGADLPLLGLGTWQSTDPKALGEALRAALDAGYSLIDTAYAYGNEKVIGEVLHEYISGGKRKRGDIFITTKLPCLTHSPSEVDDMIDGQLKDLQLDYVDLYLIHVPCPVKRVGDRHAEYKPLLVDGRFVPDLIDLVDTWKAMEKVFRDGKAKAIGLSNFSISQIQKILDNCNVPPHNHQVECHLYWPQTELFDFCKKHNITFTAYGPLGSPGRKAVNPAWNWPEGEPMKDPVVLELSAKYKKTPAQIVLRYLVQRGISAIPKSINVNRVRENFDIFDFKLTDEEKQKLDNVPKRVRLFPLDIWSHHPWYPFLDVDVSKLKSVRLS